MEDEATVIGIGFASMEPVAIFPRKMATKNENIFLQLLMDIQRIYPEIERESMNCKAFPMAFP